MFRCRCQCGDEYDVLLNNLKRGSKGCRKCKKNKKKREVQMGDVFGSLTVLKENESTLFKCGTIKRNFLCKCKCGEITNLQSDSLKKGMCGKCGRKEGGKKNQKEVNINDKFGDWTVLGEGQRKVKTRYMVCRCKCGILKPVMLRHLISGKSKRCRECTIRDYRISKGLDRDIPMNPKNNTCLLYTSPSPRDRTRSRMPSSA